MARRTAARHSSTVPRSLLLVALLLSAAPAHAQPAIDDGEFVAVDGARFVVGGEPFHVIGANAAVMHGTAHRDAMPATLDAIRFDGLNVIRIWALGEYPADASASLRPYAFRIGEDGWVATSFAHLDEVLRQARARDLRAIVVLANRWGNFGGVTQYVRWSGIDYPRESLERHALGAFYESEHAERSYREHVARVVRAHRDDPTVFAWELMNELEAIGGRGETAMLRWIERQSRYVRSLDENHLISAGHIGYARMRERRAWARACAIETIDYCDSHAYPIRHGQARNRADAAAVDRRPGSARTLRRR